MWMDGIVNFFVYLVSISILNPRRSPKRDPESDWIQSTTNANNLVQLASACKKGFRFDPKTKLKGAGSRNVNKLLSKRRVFRIFDCPYHRDFPLLFSKYRCYCEDGLLNFLEK